MNWKTENYYLVVYGVTEIAWAKKVSSITGNPKTQWWGTKIMMRRHTWVWICVKKYRSALLVSLKEGASLIKLGFSVHNIFMHIFWNLPLSLYDNLYNPMNQINMLKNNIFFYKGKITTVHNANMIFFFILGNWMQVICKINDIMINKSDCM